MATVTSDEVLGLFVERIREVLALDTGVRVPRGAPTEDWRQVRFDEDLHADSLDLVEVIEGVERELRRRGVAVSVADADLADIRRVGDAVDVVLAQAGGRRA